MKCPVCKKLIQEESISFCIQCGWGFQLFLYELSDNNRKLYDMQLAIAQKNWQELIDHKNMESDCKKDVFESANLIKELETDCNNANQQVKDHIKANKELKEELNVQQNKVKKLAAKLSKITEEDSAEFQVILKKLQEIQNKPDKPKEEFTNSLDMNFVYIKPGTFMMGSPEHEFGRINNEQQHEVILTQGFYMKTTEVTQGQWESVMGNNPSHFKNCGDDCPVEKVSWNDAHEYIQKLNIRENTNKYRLPTEAEWEYACRAGSTTKFNWGTEADCSKANYGNGYSKECEGSNPGETTRVKSYLPNAWGLYDMHGNVLEWCENWYYDYPSGSITDPVGPDNGSLRVLRGGNWYDDAGNCRSAFRDWFEPNTRYFNCGFRLAASLYQ